MAGTLTRFWSRSEGRCWCYEMLNHVSVCLRVLSTRSMRLLLCKNMKPVCKWTITQRLHNGLCNEATRIICFSMAGLSATCLLSAFENQFLTWIWIWLRGVGSSLGFKKLTGLHGIASGFGHVLVSSDLPMFKCSFMCRLNGQLF